MKKILLLSMVIGLAACSGHKVEQSENALISLQQNEVEMNESYIKNQKMLENQKMEEMKK